MFADTNSKVNCVFFLCQNVLFFNKLSPILRVFIIWCINNFYICGNWREVRVYGFFKLLIGGLIPHAPLLMCQKTTKNLDFFRICFCDASLLLKSYDL